LFRAQGGAVFWHPVDYRGLMIDFRGLFLPAASRATSRLSMRVAGDLHARGMKLYVGVPPRNNEYNYPAIAAAADGVGADELRRALSRRRVWARGFSGLVCAEFDVRPRPSSRKTRLFAPSPTTDTTGFSNRRKARCRRKNTTETVSVQDAWLAARDSEEDVSFDDDALNPHFTYIDEHGFRHDIWFLDGVTNAESHASRTETLAFRRFALWAAGAGKTALCGACGTWPGDGGRHRQTA